MNGWVFALALVLGMLYFTQVPSNWRALILLVVPIGFLQEPVRKLTPNQPVELQLTVVMIFVLAFLAAATRFGAPTMTPLSGKNKNTRTLLTLFIGLALIQSIQSLIRTGTPLVPMVGLLTYLLPMPALWVAYVYTRRPDDVRRFLMLYMLAAGFTTLSVVASYRGIDSAAFRQIGDGPMVVYHQVTGVVELYCGYLRSPEVAAWHAAAAACTAITLAITFKGLFARVLAPPLVLSNLYVIILTGRRKALAIVALYVVTYVAGLLMARKKSSRLAAIGAISVGLALTAGMLVMAPESSVPNPHLERGASTIDDVWERFQKLGLESILWAYNAGGLFGIGTGAGAQGLQHVQGAVLQGSAEGGLGRIMLELGAPGLVLAVLCAVGVAKTARYCLSLAYHHSGPMFRLQLGLVAFIAANVPIFVGAAQIFGDPFVLLILGLNLGFILSTPRIIALQTRSVGFVESSLVRSLAAMNQTARLHH